MAKPRTTHGVVYGLVDPRNGVVRYVGKTVKALCARFTGHTKSARDGGTTYKDRWIRSLFADGLSPIPAILLVARREELAEEEIALIAAFRKECALHGLTLTNGTDGGDGMLGCPPWNKGRTKETDLRIALNGERISASLTGRRLSPEHASVLGDRCRGKHLSAQHKAKLVASHKGMSGRTHTPETRAKMRAAQAQLSESQVQEARRLWMARKTVRTISQKLGVREHLLYAVIEGKTWLHLPLPDGKMWDKSLRERAA